MYTELLTHGESQYSKHKSELNFCSDNHDTVLRERNIMYVRYCDIRRLSLGIKRVKSNGVHRCIT